MATFQYENAAFTVRGMSRTAGLECLREFDAITPLYTDNTIELLREGDWLAVKYAPVTLRIGEDAFTDGERVIKSENDGDVKIVLPITRDAFFALPLPVTEAWITAAHLSNGFFIEALKKVFALPTMATTSEPKSGSASSPDLTARHPETKTTGQ